MVSLLPSSHITDAGTRLMIQLIVAYLLFTALALSIALKLSVSIADRIIAVAYQMESVRTGRPMPMDTVETGCDEIGVLTDTYNYMTEEINDLMNSREKASEDLRLAEFRALQAQINPHFLYNTLDMINWLSRTGRKEDVTRAIQTLSRFYKLTLSKRGLMNTIEEELEHTELYVELQNMRYDNCVSFVVDVPDELSEYTIPKLTFQPIVENAWLHGIMGTEEKRGNILLTGWRQGEDIIFLISDDGIGITPETLESILAEENGDPMPNGTSDSVHIGVYNTNLRLKRLYGESYGLTFQSSHGTGTEVTIKIPAKRREDSPV
ncbi:sensor histidine kinase [Hungatella hathewayi]|uniref:sensor histidine kinase n=3 Tax=Lachnospiraceae TaxID=186803 RepID=UPI001FAA2029|nr:sensor histidine kinase [Hungatella hathewayi]